MGVKKKIVGKYVREEARRFKGASNLHLDVHLPELSARRKHVNDLLENFSAVVDATELRVPGDHLPRVQVERLRLELGPSHLQSLHIDRLE